MNFLFLSFIAFRIVAIGNELKVAAFGSELKVANPKQHGNIYMKIKWFIFALKTKKLYIYENKISYIFKTNKDATYS